MLRYNCNYFLKILIIQNKQHVNNSIELDEFHEDQIQNNSTSCAF